jgi:hypothetical protein
MIAAQRARDAMLAHSLIAHAERDGAVLIAGSGHVRTDRATPTYLHRRVPNKTIISVAFTEVAAGKDEPQGYVPRVRGRRPAFRYLWFTSRSQGQNSCEQFKERLRLLDAAETPM